MRVVFFGTPAFALPSLKLVHRHHELLAVVTQPDKPRGRHLRVAVSPVKEYALAHAVPVLQPENLKDAGFQAEMRRLAPDAAAVVAYGKIIPAWLLELARYGCINVHGSLLPRWRGAAPIQRAIMAGDTVTGITTIRLDEGMDTGPILLKQEVPVESDDTGGSLAAHLAEVGAELLIKTLAALEEGTVSPHSQDEDGATLAPSITKEETLINWSRPADNVRNLVRALNPRPAAHTSADGLRLKVLAVEAATSSGGEPGTMTAADREPLVETAAGAVVLREVQPEGGKVMTGAEFLRGHQRMIGRRLGA